MTVWHWLTTLHTPLDPLHGDGYGFWSGIGSGSPLFAFLLVWLRHHNCHVTGCPRIGHPVAGTSHRACRRHHPKLNHRRRTTASDIATAHHRANRS